MSQDSHIADGLKSEILKRVDRRSFGRVRWIRKARVVRASGANIIDHMRYVLTDPEVDNFSYDLANDPEVGAWLEDEFGAEDGRGSLAEARADQDLWARIDSACAQRPWSMKPVSYTHLTLPTTPYV